MELRAATIDMEGWDSHFAQTSSINPLALEGPGDAPVRINHRDMLAPVLARHGAADLARVFPDYELDPLKLFA